MMDLPYRDCVVAVIQSEDGKSYLVGERTGVTGAWQFPQGGIDAGESAEEALLRELQEEIGCDQVEVIRKSSCKVVYDFPLDLKAKIAMKYRGQSQVWFLLKLKKGRNPDLEHADGEFQQLSWWSIDAIMKNIVAFKRAAYEAGLASLGIKG